MKRIDIEICDKCPNLTQRGQFCRQANRYITGINGMTGFPDWCPLPDVEEKKCDGGHCDNGTGYCMFCGMKLQ